MDYNNQLRKENMTEIELDLRKSMRANLQDKYAELRKLKEKKSGLLTAIEQTRKEMGSIEQKVRVSPANAAKSSPASSSKKSSKNKFQSKSKKSQWFESFLAFTTSAGRRVVAGKNAKQNDELYAKHLSPQDLFFHADIQGAPTVILKDGQKANDEEKNEAAQWAASFSSAWKVGAAAVDVFALKPEQVSKHQEGGYAGPGTFFLSGEREWFKQVPLKLRVGLKEGKLCMLPAKNTQTLEKAISLTPGAMPKEEAAKLLSGKFGVSVEEIAPLMPNGKFSIA